jgi:hypothetical protein
VSGFPITDELVTSDHRGRRSEFQYASMYWSRHSGAHEIHGLIRDHRNRAQGIRGLFGYPITDETPTQYGSRGAFNNFEHGAIHWSFRNGIESSTRCPHFAPCRAGPRFNGTCNPIATLDDLRRQANERLSATDRAIGELTTPLKRGEIIANRLDDEGMLRPQRRGQAGAITAVVDRWLWTGDVFLDQFPVEGKDLSAVSRPRYVRLEIRPENRYANHEVDRRAPSGCKFACIPLALHHPCWLWPKKLLRGADIPPGATLRFGGLILVDRGHDFLEVHPDTEFSVG